MLRKPKSMVKFKAKKQTSSNFFPVSLIAVRILAKIYIFVKPYIRTKEYSLTSTKHEKKDKHVRKMTCKEAFSPK